MTRKLFNFAAIGSLALCVASGVLWVRGCFYAADYAMIGHETTTDTGWTRTEFTAESGGGAIGLIRWHNDSPLLRPSAKGSDGWYFWSHPQTPMSPVHRWNLNQWPTHWGFAGISLSHTTGPTNLGVADNWGLVIPLWLVCGLTVVPALCWLARRRSARLSTPGFDVIGIGRLGQEPDQADVQ